MIMDRDRNPLDIIKSVTKYTEHGAVYVVQTLEEKDIVTRALRQVFELNASAYIDRIKLANLA